MKFIFIAGASASGKSTLSVLLSNEFTRMGISNVILKMDDYSVEAPDNITDIAHYRQVTNFDRLEMYDIDLLGEHLLQLENGLEIQKPDFDFATNRRISFETIMPQDVVIVEGLFALALAKKLPPELDKTKVFIGPSSYSSLLEMRTRRDQNERGFTSLQTLSKERKYVGPCFFDVIAKSKNGVDIDITNDPDERHAAIMDGVAQIIQDFQRSQTAHLKL